MRPRSIGFLAADVRGVCGYAFCDFGDAHIVSDADGEACKSAVVLGISRGSPATVTAVDVEGKPLDFRPGDYVVFREVGGMVELNDGLPRRVGSVCASAHTFTLVGDAAGFGEHTIGGLAEQVKAPAHTAFGSLAERIICPVALGEGALVTPDPGKRGRAEQLHVAFAGLEAFRARHGGALPTLRSAEHAAEVVALAKEWAAANSCRAEEGALVVEAVDETVARTLALLAGSELSALCAVFGGIVAHEAVKFTTGKYTPLRQWLYLDAAEVLPDGHEALPAAEFAPAGSRYDHLLALFGRTAQARIAGMRVLLAGAGALGGELLKGFALMGVGCGATAGCVTVADAARVKPSDLHRHSLLRAADIGRSKCAATAAAARAVNSDLRVRAVEEPADKASEATLDFAFWAATDLVVSAVDNASAREYVDKQCILYEKPLLISNLLGVKGSTQVVAPRQTACYSDAAIPDAAAQPQSGAQRDMEAFPHEASHCVEWARDRLFERAFSGAVADAAAFAADPVAWLRESRAFGAPVADVAAAMRGARAEEAEGERQGGGRWRACVAAARDLFREHFCSNIRELLRCFPPASAVRRVMTTGGSVPFWSPPRRVPAPIEFDVANETHFAFLVSAAAMLAGNYGVPLPAGYDTRAGMDSILASLPAAAVPEQEGVEGGVDAAEAAAGAFLTSLAASDDGTALSALTLMPAKFDPDDDSNHHVDVVTAAANLRATNFRIPPSSRLAAQVTAGRISPAVVTAASAVAGLACLEVYKLAAASAAASSSSGGAGETAARCLRDSSLDLSCGSATVALSEPAPPTRTLSAPWDPLSACPVRAVPEGGFTRWDRVEIAGWPDLTPAGLWTTLCARLGLDAGVVRLVMVSCGRSILYSPALFRAHENSRKDRPLRDIAEEIMDAPPSAAGSAFLVLDVSADEDAGDVLMPPVQLWLR